LLPAVNHNQTWEKPEDFRTIAEDALSSYYWGEFKRAHDLYTRALLLIPSNLGIADLADIHEQRLTAWELVKSVEEVLPAHQAGVQAAPGDGEKHFWLGYVLTRLDRHEEALREYQAALKAGYQGKCWNEIGWCYYRMGMPRESIKWFERHFEGEDDIRVAGLSQQRRAMENKIVAYAALRMTREAHDTASKYIREYGRLSWPERRALTTLGIDADAMYVSHCTRKA
jgi:tetratricopeptide (TPR) repeat protein